MTLSFDAVRALEPREAIQLVELRRAALADTPLAFAASLEDDRACDVDFVRSSLARVDRSAVFGAFVDCALVGMAGLVREEMLKMRHKALVWGMYVAPRARGRGIGGALLEAAVARAGSWPGVSAVHLAASETATSAMRLYERAGFQRWGIEPEALAWQGRRYAEHHFVYLLGDDP